MAIEDGYQLALTLAEAADKAKNKPIEIEAALRAYQSVRMNLHCGKTILALNPLFPLCVLSIGGDPDRNLPFMLTCCVCANLLVLNTVTKSLGSKGCPCGAETHDASEHNPRAGRHGGDHGVHLQGVPRRGPAPASEWLAPAFQNPAPRQGTPCTIPFETQIVCTPCTKRQLFVALSNCGALERHVAVHLTCVVRRG